MPRLAVVGSINTDLVVRVPHFAAPGETVEAASLERFGGGKGANQAVAAARLGVSVRLVGAVGTDGDSRARLEALADEGVELGAVRHVVGPGGLALIEVDENSGQNRIVLIGGANEALRPEDVTAALDGRLDPTDLVCCQLEVPLPAVAAALQLARRHGVRTLLNAVPVVPEATSLFGMVDLLLVNEIEAGQLLGSGQILWTDAAAAGAALRARGPHAVIITFGARGAFLSALPENARLPAPTVSVTDTTGAGDALVGGVCAGLVAGLPLVDAVRLGVLAGSYSVQRRGAQPSFPNRRELARWAAGTAARDPSR